MIYQEQQPNDVLTDFVKKLWCFENPSSDVLKYIILPDGYFDIIIKITGKRVNSITLFGLCTREIEVVVPAETIVIGVCLKPLAAEYILHQKIAHIRDNFETWHQSFLNLDSLEFNTFEKCSEIINNEFCSILRKIKTFDSRKKNIFDLLFKTNGGMTVQEMSTRIFWNSQQINRYFRHQFGLTLKTYSNILRCASAYSNISEGYLSPTQNYYDQAHFIKEIKRYTGHKPKELHKNENDRFLQFSTLIRL